jgi:HPt (histidine-containing phosphotransfer) domain-containing protein
LLAIFIADGASLVGKIKTAAEQNDLPALKKAAHSLKGSGSSMGALYLASLCATLDKMEPGDDINTVEQARKIEMEFERAKLALQAELKTIPS